MTSGPDGSHGVVFPESGGQSRQGVPLRSTSAFGRAVVAAALEPVDPIGARAARTEVNWRKHYDLHLRRLVEAVADIPEGAYVSAQAGLGEALSRMRWKARPDAPDAPMSAAFEGESERPLSTTSIVGTGEPERELSIPFEGTRLRGDALRSKLDDWVERGIVEPGVRESVIEVMDNPEWLALPGRTVAVLGAGAEMGPLRALTRWGATVAAVDLPRPALWDRLRATVAESAGTMLVPTSSDKVAGADLMHDLGAVAQWVNSLEGELVLGNYVYADAGTNLRLSAATDALAVETLRARPDAALAYLATPTDVFVVPDSAVAQSEREYAEPAPWSRARGPLRFASRGRLLSRQYAPGASPAISDTIVLQQGPNYLLSKRVHRWRARVSATDGRLVSMNVAPPTRTASVTKNRVLAAAYAGAHRFGVEVFAPATSNTLMAALLVRDLNTDGSVAAQWFPRSEQTEAVHGGLWRAPYAPRTALGIAALLGLGGSRA